MSTRARTSLSCRSEWHALQPPGAASDQTVSPRCHQSQYSAALGRRYPHERECLFSPLCFLQARGRCVCGVWALAMPADRVAQHALVVTGPAWPQVSDTSVDGAMLVMRIRPCINQNSLTVEQTIGQLRASHLQLVELLTSSLRFAGAPTRALSALEAVRSRAEEQAPAHFLVPSNYKAATDKALDAQQAAFGLLEQESTWKDDGDGAALAERMRVLATLCARADQRNTAIALLRMALERSPLPDDQAEAMRRAVADATDGEASAASGEGAAAGWRLEAVQALLATGAQPPWPPVIVELARGSERACAALVRAKDPADRFGVGAAVRAWDTKGNRWEPGHVQRRHADGTCDVKTAFKTLERLCAAHVLAVSAGGGGALLRAAAAVGAASLVGALLEARVSVFEADDECATAAHAAAAAGHASVCRLLVAAGANGHVYDARVRTPVALARAGRHAAALRVFAPSTADVDVKAAEASGSVLLEAAASGDVDRLRAAVQDEGGARGVDEVGARGVTALMLASRSGCAEAVSLLLAARAAVDAASEGGCTALHMAAEEGSEAAVVALVDAGAELERADNAGMTPLFIACQNGHEAAARLLLDRGAAVDAAMNNGATPLYIACQNGHEEVARLLLDGGAGVDAADSIGVSALALALVRGDTHLELILREAGATADEARLPLLATHALVTFSTAGSLSALAAQGKVFYELTLARVGPCPQIGWAASGFAPGGGDGVGDDALSWGADGARGMLWHNGSAEWPVRWEDGDVVGCAADVEQGTAWFGRNGEWVVAFEGCAEAWQQGVFPAITGQRMAFAVNEASRFAGPTPEFVQLAIPKLQLLGNDSGALLVTPERVCN